MNTLKEKFQGSGAPLATFFILTVFFYLLGYWLIFRLERASPLMMSVGLAALVTCLFHRRRLSSLGLLWGENRYQWISFFVPIGIAVASYLIIWGLGLAEFNSDFASGARDTYNLAEWNDVSIIVFYVVLTMNLASSCQYRRYSVKRSLGGAS